MFIAKGFILFIGGFHITIKKKLIEKSLDATMYNVRKSEARNAVRDNDE